MIRSDIRKWFCRWFVVILGIDYRHLHAENRLLAALT